MNVSTASSVPVAIMKQYTRGEYNALEIQTCYFFLFFSQNSIDNNEFLFFVFSEWNRGDWPIIARTTFPSEVAATNSFPAR